MFILGSVESAWTSY